MERELLLRLGESSHALRLSSVAGVGEGDGVHSVPGARPPVRGVVEWRGELVTVVDLCRLLGVDAPDDPPCLIRLAPPFGRIALWVPGRLKLTSAGACGRSEIDLALLLRELALPEAGRS